jgi:hypothetical protein
MPKNAVSGSDGLIAINMSVPRALRARLEEAARASGRSLASEASRMMELGFRYEDQQKTLLAALERVEAKVEHIESGIWRHAVKDMESLDRPPFARTQAPKRSTAPKSGRR